MLDVAQLKFPPRTATAAERIEWANEYLWDYAEGKLSRAALSVVWATLHGWADTATETDRRAYKAMAGRVEAHLKGE